MSDTSSNTWVSVISMSLAFVTGIVSSVLVYKSSLAQEANEAKKTYIEQARLDSEQEETDRKRLQEIIIRLSSKDPQIAAEGRAMLLIFFPDEAASVLKVIALIDNQKPNQSIVKEASILAESSYSWGIVSGGNSTLDAAKKESERMRNAGFNADIYFRNNSYRTVIGYYADKSESNRVNLAVRSAVSIDAYVVNLDSWCPNKNSKEGYQECK